MWKRLLLMVDDLESGQAAVDFTIGLARATAASVFVLHFRELSTQIRVVPLETPADAKLVVDEAVLALTTAGVSAEGSSCSVVTTRIPAWIAEKAVRLECDAIVLGSRRLTGLGRLSGRGVREHVLRLSHLPVVVAPAPLVNGVRSPAALRSEHGTGEWVFTPEHPEGTK